MQIKIEIHEQMILIRMELLWTNNAAIQFRYSLQIINAASFFWMPTMEMTKEIWMDFPRAKDNTKQIEFSTINREIIAREHAHEFGYAAPRKSWISCCV